MDRRTEKFLKETRQRELDKYDCYDRTPTHTHVVDLGPFGKVPIQCTWFRFPGGRIKLTDLSYYDVGGYSVRQVFDDWHDAAIGNHAARIQDPIVINTPGEYEAVFGRPEAAYTPLADNSGHIPERSGGWSLVVDENIPPDRIIMASDPFSFRVPYFSYTIGVLPVEYAQNPIVWREECPRINGVERWLLRVQQENEFNTPPDLEWD